MSIFAIVLALSLGGAPLSETATPGPGQGARPKPPRVAKPGAYWEWDAAKGWQERPIPPVPFSALESRFSGGVFAVRVDGTPAGPAWFLLDSGCPVTVGLPSAFPPGVEEARFSVRSPGGALPLPCQRFDLPFVSPIPGLDVRGLVGLDFLEDKALLVDYRALKASVVTGSLGSWNAAQALGGKPEELRAIPFVLEDGWYRVRALVGGKPFMMILDTGADVAGLNMKKASALGMVATGSHDLNAFGRIKKTKAFRDVTMEVGGLKLKADYVTADEPEPGENVDDGVLNVCALAEASGGKVLIDFVGRTLYLALPKPSARKS